ncbi:unnamed protein product [Symbiodinium pilosum]|uniref:Uncharacterized protein n=1 Tax=Symbiodinium pilosum TaxID=2952 RepID=A0A812QVJ5_SYMPI|nr:unnamed protein product [Symbiodinium pilosum]
MAEEAEAPERELEMPAMQAIAEASGEKKERTSSKVIEDAISAGLLPSQRPVQDEALGREKKRPVDLGAPAEDSGILGSLGILEVPLGPPLAPLQQQPKAAPPAIASVARSGDNDWYGSSTSGTPRKEEEEGPKIAAPASESSAEDLHFPSRQLTPREDNEKPLAAENQRPAAATEVAENTTPASDPTPERQTRMPERIPVQQEEAEDTEEADLDAMIPFSAREKAQRQISPLVQVVEQPQVPNDPRKSKEAAKSPEGSSLGSLASPEALQDASAGSFSFGEQGHNGLGEASPLQVMPAKGDVGASPASKASVPAPAANTANSGVPAARPTPTILRDLGLDESSEDTPRTDSKEAAKASPPAQPALASPTSYSPASSKALPKRSNPLARVGGGRGNLLQGSGGDFLGGGMAGLGLPGSRDVGSGGALSSLAALRPKAKARPKIGSLPGGPIDWSQKEDFK